MYLLINNLNNISVRDNFHEIGAKREKLQQNVRQKSVHHTRREMFLRIDEMLISYIVSSREAAREFSNLRARGFDHCT